VTAEQAAKMLGVSRALVIRAKTIWCRGTAEAASSAFAAATARAIKRYKYHLIKALTAERAASPVQPRNSAITVSSLSGYPRAHRSGSLSGLPAHRGLETAIDAATLTQEAEMQDTRDTTANPSRRRLIAGSSAALFAGAALATSVHAEPKFPAASGDDAQILRLLAEWLPLQRRYHALSDHTAEMDPVPAEIARELSHVVTAQHDLAEEMAELRATTLEGLRAKAAVLLSYSSYLADGERLLWENHDELMGWSIARDLLGDATAKADYRP
jgi:hypothetical protein